MTILLTVLAMAAFAANSILARLALASHDTDALGYTGIRLAAGAAMLVAIVVVRGAQSHMPRPRRIAGGWWGAGVLFVYALAFSSAYVLLGAGTGALILFASVQIGMLGWAFRQGDRPGGLEWLGFAVAAAALVYLILPGLVAPSPIGGALMVVSGLAWGTYTLIGRSSLSPIDDNAGNFIRCLPAALALAAIGAWTHPPTILGVVYAVASGALASGLGYVVWYAALPRLSRTNAAFVQLTVPVIAAIGGVVFIAEPVTPRLIVASIGILGGVALVLGAASRRRIAA